MGGAHKAPPMLKAAVSAHKLERRPVWKRPAPSLRVTLDCPHAALFGAPM